MGIKTGFESRWQENMDAWTFTPTQTFGIVLMVVAVIVGGWGFAVVASDPDKFTVVSEFYANISSELFSIVITVLVLDQLNRARDKREREANQKALDERLDKQELARLKVLMGSDEQVVTRIAVAELKARNWIYDGSLEEAMLWGTNLEGADLIFANLSGAKVYDANLAGAYLSSANLVGADLRFANLSGARLNRANLSGAYLLKANLSGAYLLKANLSGANLVDAKFDEETVLPDGSTWSADVDMAKFTNPEHPEFVIYDNDGIPF